MAEYERKINLLVTGGCGFIGSNFINYIFASGKYKIINFDAMYYCADEKNVSSDIRNNLNYTLVKGNLCSEDLINHVLKSYDIEQVVHFAAQSHVQNSFDDSLQFT
jgi:dTDP-D-glucose 4,6-dehydratase